MPNCETTSETTKSKQPTGSSKRKRKQSIKRNIVLEENTDNSDVKPSKVEKTYGKRARGEKTKSEKDCEESAIIKSENTDEEKSLNAKVKTEYDSEESVKLDSLDKRNEKKEEGDACDKLSITECSSSKQQCQNCKFCSEHIITKEEQDDFKEKHSRNKKKFQCEICAEVGTPRIYNSAEKHRHHMATVHEINIDEIKKFECSECPEGVWFPTKSKYSYHLGTKHPGIIKFICEVCTETFKLKANYKNHMKTHKIVVQKKFSCDVCNGTFVNKAGYEAHKKRFPGPHIKQSCLHCGFSFSREKHMKNHRCKTLLLQEAAARANKTQKQVTHEGIHLVKSQSIDSKNALEAQNFTDKKIATDPLTDIEAVQKKLSNEGDSQANKRVVFHRIIPRRNQEQTVYRPVQMQTQNVPESVVVQELREIDFEGGTFIAATTEPEPQFIVRDINGHLVPGNQILQLDINDVQPGEESQVYLADWNIVTPYVIREKSP